MKCIPSANYADSITVYLPISLPECLPLQVVEMGEEGGKRENFLKTVQNLTEIENKLTLKPFFDLAQTLPNFMVHVQVARSSNGAPVAG